MTHSCPTRRSSDPFRPPPAFLPWHQLQHEPRPTRCCGCRARFACSAACCCIVGWPRFETNTWPPPRLPSGPPATPVQPEASRLTDGNCCLLEPRVLPNLYCSCRTDRLCGSEFPHCNKQVLRQDGYEIGRAHV